MGIAIAPAKVAGDAERPERGDGLLGQVARGLVADGAGDERSIREPADQLREPGGRAGVEEGVEPRRGADGAVGGERHEVVAPVVRRQLDAVVDDGSALPVGLPRAPDA